MNFDVSKLAIQAQNEIGGRVRTVRVEKDLVFDYGAQWIHGQDKNPIHELAKRRHLLSNDPSFEGQGNVLTLYNNNINIQTVDIDFRTVFHSKWGDNRCRFSG